jgi:hypothetical protein
VDFCLRPFPVISITAEIRELPDGGDLVFDDACDQEIGEEDPKSDRELFQVHVVQWFHRAR